MYRWEEGRLYEFFALSRRRRQEMKKTIWTYRSIEHFSMTNLLDLTIDPGRDRYFAGKSNCLFSGAWHFLGSFRRGRPWLFVFVQRRK